jgi:hypothetical protein
MIIGDGAGQERDESEFLIIGECERHEPGI